MHEPTELVLSFDARNWAKHFKQTVDQHPEVPFDEETMVTWFANALMAGYDHNQRKINSRISNTGHDWYYIKDREYLLTPEEYEICSNEFISESEKQTILKTINV